MHTILKNFIKQEQQKQIKESEENKNEKSHKKWNLIKIHIFFILKVLCFCRKSKN